MIKYHIWTRFAQKPKNLIKPMAVAHFRIWKSWYFVDVYVLRKKNDRKGRDEEIKKREKLEKTEHIENNM